MYFLSLELFIILGSALLSIYLFWSDITFLSFKKSITNKDGLVVLSESIFDIWLQIAIISAFVGRLTLILGNLSQYGLIGWGFTPWIREDTKTVWLTQFPWRFFNFVEGVDLAGVIIGGFLGLFIVARLRKISMINLINAFMKGMLAFILALSFGSFFTTVKGLSMGSVRGIGLGEYLAQNTFGIGVFLILMLFVVLIVWIENNKNVLLKLQDKRFNLQFLIFSAFMSVTFLLIRYQEVYENPMLYLSAFPLIAGVYVYLFIGREGGGLEPKKSIDKTKKSATALKIDVSSKGIRKNDKTRRKTR